MSKKTKTKSTRPLAVNTVGTPDMDHFASVFADIIIEAAIRKVKAENRLKQK